MDGKERENGSMYLVVRMKCHLVTNRKEYKLFIAFYAMLQVPVLV
jgi:hypothetical protein